MSQKALYSLLSVSRQDLVLAWAGGAAGARQDIERQARFGGGGGCSHLWRADLVGQGAAHYYTKLLMKEPLGVMEWGFVGDMDNFVFGSLLIGYDWMSRYISAWSWQGLLLFYAVWTYPTIQHFWCIHRWDLLLLPLNHYIYFLNATW